MSKRLSAFLLSFTTITLVSPSWAQEHDDLNAANNPLTPKITFNFQNCYTPELKGIDDRHANQFLCEGLFLPICLACRSYFALPCRSQRPRNSRATT